ncbi:uracil-DNA glycosylase [Rhodococcus hoagii]|nr:uracil-DNA glycosylase [Prescottella equi]
MGEALAPVEGRIAEMGDFLRAEIAAVRQYLPSGENVLRAFTHPFEDVRVLIVGQDPYPTPGHAVGLSFSVAPRRPAGAAEPEQHLRRVQPGPRVPDAVERRPDALDRDGVLLLNSVLTVAPGEAGSHRRKGWEAVTEQRSARSWSGSRRWSRSCGGVTLPR